MIRKIARRIRQIFVYLTSDKEAQALSKSLRLKRNTQGVFSFNGRNIKFTDASAFVFNYKEIFRDHVYKFRANNEPAFIIDCGANIGLSVMYFKQLYPTAKILAFEPDKEIFNLLQENINAIESKNDISLLNKGVWDEDGFISFINQGSLGGRIIFNQVASGSKNESLIETVKLSKYINSKVDFLKLDIEGAEVKVIEEIEEKLPLIDHIFIEYHSSANGEQQLQNILSILSRNNFRYYIDTPFRLRKNPFVDKRTMISFDLFLNIFAIRKA